ncbi:MAG: PLP-dependent aminotransferase family protein, partial [Rhizobiaceae bacterium]
AFFLSLGFYDVFVRRLHRTYRERWTVMGDALKEHFPDAKVTRGLGGSSYWIDLDNTGGGHADTEVLAKRALDGGVLIEPGAIYFDDERSKSCMRLGFSSIPTGSISPGLAKLRRIAQKHP